MGIQRESKIITNIFQPIQKTRSSLSIYNGVQPSSTVTIQVMLGSLSSHPFLFFFIFSFCFPQVQISGVLLHTHTYYYLIYICSFRFYLIHLYIYIISFVFLLIRIWQGRSFPSWRDHCLVLIHTLTFYFIYFSFLNLFLLGIERLLPQLDGIENYVFKSIDKAKPEISKGVY